MKIGRNREKGVVTRRLSEEGDTADECTVCCASRDKNCITQRTRGHKKGQEHQNGGSNGCSKRVDSSLSLSFSAVILFLFLFLYPWLLPHWRLETASLRLLARQGAGPILPNRRSIAVRRRLIFRSLNCPSCPSRGSNCSSHFYLNFVV